MQHVLASACLLGTPVRYKGADVSCDAAILQRWAQAEADDGLEPA